MSAERTTVAPPEPAELAAMSEVDMSIPVPSEEPWLGLDFRVVWIDAVKFLVSLAPGLIGLIYFPTGPIWPLLAASAFGVTGTVLDFKRWLHTRYRITEGHVERRTGWLVRKFRNVPRERIRSVDTSAKLFHRMAGLRIVHIGTGEARMSATFKLDALSRHKAEALRLLLVPDQQAEEQDESAEQKILSGIPWYWVFYNIFNFWAFFAAAFFLNVGYWFLDSFGINLLAVVDGLISSTGGGVTGKIVFSVLAAFVLGFCGLAIDFASKYWNFELVRTTEKGGALLTRHGLLSIQTVYREDSRIRGIDLHEPLLWRWIRLAETKVVTTGIHSAREESAKVLPRSPRGTARRVAKYVLPDGFDPLEARLLRHPVSALGRRLFWATNMPLLVAGLLVWLASIGSTAPDAWQFPLLFLPLTWILALVAYFSLGHTRVGPYIVVRSGAMARSTVALQNRAVIGWTLQQTLFQRLWKQITIGIPTAAGSRYYRAPDAGVDQALAFIKGATPWLAEEFIDGGSASASFVPRTNLDHPSGGFGSRNAAH